MNPTPIGINHESFLLNKIWAHSDSAQVSEFFQSSKAAYRACHSPNSHPSRSMWTIPTRTPRTHRHVDQTKLCLLLPISHVTERMTSRYREKQLQNDGIKRYQRYHMNPMQWSLIVGPAVFRRPEGTTKHHTTKRVIRKSCMIQEPTILRLGPGPAIILNFCLDSVKNIRIVESNDAEVC